MTQHCKEVSCSIKSSEVQHAHTHTHTHTHAHAHAHARMHTHAHTHTYTHTHTHTHTHRHDYVNVSADGLNSDILICGNDLTADDLYNGGELDYIGKLLFKSNKGFLPLQVLEGSLVIMPLLASAAMG